MDLDGFSSNRRVYLRQGHNQPGNEAKQAKVCFHWRAGKCTRVPCPFLHRELPHPPSSTSSFTASRNGYSTKRGFTNEEDLSGPPSSRRATFNSSGPSNWGGRNQNNNNGYKRSFQKTEKVCNYWLQSNCTYGEKCRFMHGWSVGDSLKLLTDLDGHKLRVTGIAMSSDKLYSGSQDKTVRVWDSNSGQCLGEVNVGHEVGCVICEGPWVFVGARDFVKAWNTQSNAELTLPGPVGLVYSLTVGNNLLFAGAQDGAILAWTFNVVTNNFEPAASLSGHTNSVVSLIVGANKLFSGSMDNSIRVWSLDTLQCVQTLIDHSSVVMSVLCWDQYLLSCSLDQTIKVWAAAENGVLEMVYSHVEENGIVAMCGQLDCEGKPVLLCSCSDNVVRLYDLPSFSERGKIFAKQEIRAIHGGPGGLFFTGDGTGQVRVWTCLPSAT